MENDHNSKELAYRVTNESLEAVVTGLNPQQEDSILAICGSGDQAFAMLEKAGQIVVVDSLPKQINYFARRKNLLKEGEFEEFLNPGEISSENRDLEQLKIRNRYFSEERLKAIQPKLKDSWRVRRITGDLFNLVFPEGEFNKIYLSNILTYSLEPETIGLAQGRLKTIAKWLSERGLIYLAEYKPIINGIAKKYGDNEKSFLHSLGLVVNQERTEKAQEFQKAVNHLVKWEPEVLQKVA